MSLKHLAKGSQQPPLQNGKIRLYSMRFCPYAERVHLVLDAKQIPYDVVYINLTEKPEWYLEKLSTGKVPLIEFENGDILYESLIIVDYLDDAYNNNKSLLYPTDSLMKAKDRLLLEQFKTISETMIKVILKLDLNNNIDNYKEIVFNGLKLLDQQLAQRRFFTHGDDQQPGILDYMIWPFYERIDLLSITAGQQFHIKHDQYKYLLAWCEAMRENQAVKKNALDIEIHKKYLLSKLAGSPDYNMLAS